MRVAGVGTDRYLGRPDLDILCACVAGAALLVIPAERLLAAGAFVMCVETASGQQPRVVVHDLVQRRPVRLFRMANGTYDPASRLVIHCSSWAWAP